MSDTLKQIESPFSDQYHKLLEINKGIFQQLLVYPFNLESREISDAIIQRMDAFWWFHVNNNEYLNRHTNSVAADFFTETCLLYFKAYFEGKNQKYAVSSEESLPKEEGGFRRPDILIRKEDKIVAVVELKVNGSGWANILQNVEDNYKDIKKIAPDAFFGVFSYWDIPLLRELYLSYPYISLLTFNSEKSKQTPTGTAEELLKHIENHHNPQA